MKNKEQIEKIIKEIESDRERNLRAATEPFRPAKDAVGYLETARRCNVQLDILKWVLSDVA